MRSNARSLLVLVLALTAIVSLGHLAWFGSTPLGQHPVLDGREMLTLANDIARGSSAWAIAVLFLMAKERSPWLCWNPLGWAVVFAPGRGGVALAWRSHSGAFLKVLGAAYATGVLLYFVSARFRLALVIWLCLLAALLLSRITDATRRTRLAAGGVVLAALAASLFPIPAEMREETLTEDWILLAEASINAGQGSEAEIWVQKVLERQPQRASAQALHCAARYLQWLDNLGSASATVSPQWLRDSSDLCRKAESQSNQAAYLGGYLLLAQCRIEEATAGWMHIPLASRFAAPARSAAAAARGEWSRVERESPIGRMLAAGRPVGATDAAFLRVITGQSCE